MKTEAIRLDGRFADIEHRRHLLSNNPNNWSQFSDYMGEDAVNRVLQNNKTMPIEFPL